MHVCACAYVCMHECVRVRVRARAWKYTTRTILCCASTESHGPIQSSVAVATQEAVPDLRLQNQEGWHILGACGSNACMCGCKRACNTDVVRVHACGTIAYVIVAASST